MTSILAPVVFRVTAREVAADVVFEALLIRVRGRVRPIVISVRVIASLKVM